MYVYFNALLFRAMLTALCDTQMHAAGGASTTSSLRKGRREEGGKSREIAVTIFWFLTIGSRLLEPLCDLHLSTYCGVWIWALGAWSLAGIPTGILMMYVCMYYRHVTDVDNWDRRRLRHV